MKKQKWYNVKEVKDKLTDLQELDAETAHFTSTDRKLKQHNQQMLRNKPVQRFLEII